MLNFVKTGLAASLLLGASLNLNAAAFEAKKVAQVVATEKGVVLAGLNDLSLYTFDIDQAGSGASACNGRCADVWPAFLAEVDSVNAPFSIITRADGAKQLAYLGKPLYTYNLDAALGDIKGDGLNGVWHLAIVK